MTTSNQRGSRLPIIEFVLNNPSALLSGLASIRLSISTRNGGVSPGLLGMNLSFSVGDDPKNVEENRRRFFQSVGIPEHAIVTQHQVHGDTIQRVSQPGRMPACDGLMTNVKGLFLAVSVADCVPIFLVDPVAGCVAGVHSGWRGSNLRFLAKAVTRLKEEFDSNAENLVAYIGPSASVCCYEVGEEVAQNFDERYLRRTSGHKPHLDLKEFNKTLMLEAGVLERNIEVSPYCTICHP
jgi:YfiH family protein